MYIDIFILVIIAWALYNGWKNGLLRELASTVGFFGGLLIAALCYETLGEYLTVTGSEVNMTTSIFAFFLLWIIVPIALGAAASVLTKALKAINLDGINCLLGGVVSVLKYTLLMSCVFNMMSVLGIMNEERTADSRFYEPTKTLLTLCFNHPIVSEYLPDTSMPDTLWVDFLRDSIPGEE